MDAYISCLARGRAALDRIGDDSQHMAPDLVVAIAQRSVASVRLELC